MSVNQIKQEIPYDQSVSDVPSQHASQFLEKEHLTRQALKTYKPQVSSKQTDELVLQYMPLVHRIVNQITGFLNMSLSRDDLVSAGTIGLIKAARDYDATKDAEFKTYAYIRVRGAVIDELRNWSFVPSGVKKVVDQAQEISEKHYNTNGSFPTDAELAKEMGVDQNKLYEIMETARTRHFMSIHGLDDDAPALGQFLAIEGNLPESGVEREELRKHLVEAIQELSEKHRQVILLYYHRELTMKQISEVMELSEPRVSQLHAAALFKLSVRLKQWHDTE